MQFEKKLIILSGFGAKGTLGLERNAYGIFATLNVYNLPDLKAGEYRVGLKSPDGIFSRSLGSVGRILVRFQVEPMQLFDMHCVVFDAGTETPLLYGTNAPKKLWAGNLMDGLRSKKVESKKEDKTAVAVSADALYSSKSPEIKNYFFDVIPGGRIEIPQEFSKVEAELSKAAENLLASARRVTEYNDQALAEVNYFEKGFLSVEQEPSLTYSGHKEISPSELLNPVDRYLCDGKDGEPETVVPPCKGTDRGAALIVETKEAAASKTIPSQETLPWQYVRDYLYRNRTIVEETLNTEQTAQKAGTAGKALKPERTNSEKQTEDTLVQKEENTYPGVKVLNANGKKKPSGSEAAFTVPPVSSYRAESSAARMVPESVFYEQIKTQIDSLFGSCERYAVLEELMPETKWVRVNFDDVRFYVVGLVGTKPDYICYGVPAEYTLLPPAELGDGCRWVPELVDKPEGKGFWLMFQDAATGNVS